MRRRIIVTILFIFIVFSGCIYPWQDSKVYEPIPYTPTPVITPEPTPTRMPTPTPMPEPVRLPTGTYLRKSMDTGNGELAIYNSLSNDAVVKITSVSNPQTALVSVYIGQGSTFTVDGIEDGTYIVFYMTGSIWNSTAGRFDHISEYGRYSDTFSYTTTTDSDYIHYKVWSIELKPSGISGSPSTDVNPENFPA